MHENQINNLRNRRCPTLGLCSMSDFWLPGIRWLCWFCFLFVPWLVEAIPIYWVLAVDRLWELAILLIFYDSLEKLLRKSNKEKVMFNSRSSRDFCRENHQIISSLRRSLLKLALATVTYPFLLVRLLLPMKNFRRANTSPKVIWESPQSSDETKSQLHSINLTKSELISFLKAPLSRVNWMSKSSQAKAEQASSVHQHTRSPSMCWCLWHSNQSLCNWTERPVDASDWCTNHVRPSALQVALRQTTTKNLKIDQFHSTKQPRLDEWARVCARRDTRRRMGNEDGDEEDTPEMNASPTNTST